MTVVLSGSESKDKNKKKEPVYGYFEEELESTALETVYGYLFDKLTGVNQDNDP